MGLRIIGHTKHPGWEDTDPAPDLTVELAYIAVADRDYRAQWPMNVLPGYELAYVRDGSLLLWQGEQCLRAGPGDMLVTPPRVPHREETPAEGFSEVIYFGALFRRGSGRRCRFPLPLRPLLHLGPSSAVEQRLLQILVEVQFRPPGYMRVVSGALMEIFWHLARVSAGLTLPPPAEALDLSLSAFGREAEEYLTRHYAEPLNVDDMAAHFHLSRQYFSRLFRRAVGSSPHAYLTAVRLRQAQELLARPTLPIEAVAAKVGFTDPYYFSRCFRRHTGLTPTQYRRRAEASPGS